MIRIGRPSGLVLAIAVCIVLIGVGFAATGSAVFIGQAGAATAPPCNKAGGPVGCYFTPFQDAGDPIATLTKAKKPVDPQLSVGGPFVRDQTALVQLGKALFWDQQAGSDGQACASCHFSAGADARTKNQISPGLKAQPSDTTFQMVSGANSDLRAADFPIHMLADRTNRDSPVLRDSNDVVSSAGVFYRTFTSTPALSLLGSAFQTGSTSDTCTSVTDPSGFRVGGVNVRREEPRNTPTVINAAFNNRNFWDGRAQDVFNGVSPFGARDPNAWLYQSVGASAVRAAQARIQYASVASQSVGPPTSSFEMSCDGRTFPDIGHKLINARPLALQDVSVNDSVLGSLSAARLPHGSEDAGRSRDDAHNAPRIGGGLVLPYAELIRSAFNPQWWDADTRIAIGNRTYSQMEANFSLFWGLAIQAYVETLTSGNTPVDRFLAGDRNALTAEQQRGLNIFQSFEGSAPDPLDNSKQITVKLANGQPADTRCIACHGGAEITSASITHVQEQRLERMGLANGGCAIYDQGFLNTGVRPTRDDINLSDVDPFGNSFSETQLALNGTLSRLVPSSGDEPYGLDNTGEDGVVGPPLHGTVNCDAANIVSAFKAPQLRNVELTGPYFHNGGQLTLMQVVDFYNRGGDFSSPDLDSNIHKLGLTEPDERALVAFLLGLTDERVAHELAPFDHPSLCVANGEAGNSERVKADNPSNLPGGGAALHATDARLCIPAVGAAGTPNRLPRFLNADPYRH
jgi:cytochrome c peroxidase